MISERRRASLITICRVEFWALDLRTRTEEAVADVEQAFFDEQLHPACSRWAPAAAPSSPRAISGNTLSACGITHRAGYRDPESQAFIESWFGQFKKRVEWHPNGSIDQARHDIVGYKTNCVADQIDSITSAERVENFGQGRPIKSHRCVLLGWVLVEHITNHADGSPQGGLTEIPHLRGTHTVRGLVTVYSWAYQRPRRVQ